MVRVMKIMTQGMKDAKGTSFMEDYTYNLVPGKEGVLEAHMLEVCPSIADGPIKMCIRDRFWNRHFPNIMKKSIW